MVPAGPVARSVNTAALPSGSNSEHQSRGMVGESFQIFRGSSIRSARRRVCSSTLTLSQYLMRMIPLSTIAFSTLGT